MISTLKKKLNKKGFTLAELLVVVAIIAVLVAIAIPVFGSSLSKAKEATDLANVRAAYAEELVEQMADGEDPITVDLDDLQTAATNNTEVTHTGGDSNNKGGSIKVGDAGSFPIDGDVVITPKSGS